MRLRVSQIRAAQSLDETAELAPESVLGKPPQFVVYHHPINVAVQARVTQNDILVTGRVVMSATFNCGRCLTDYKAELKGDFQDTFSMDQDTIDLMEFIREALLIDLPLRGLCKENCLGLCNECGVNKNIEKCRCESPKTRAEWDPLKQFRFKQ